MTFTERLFRKTDIRRFYARHTDLRKLRGKPECKGLCPLHKEKTPSFYVNLESGSFKCFGCGEGGGPVQFEAARLNITAKQAASRLAKEFGLGGRRPKSKAQRPKSKLQGPRSKVQGPKSPSPSQLPTDNCQLTTGPASLTSAGRAILRALIDHGRPLPDRAIAYFARRRIRPETLERFQIAFLEDPAGAAQDLEKRFGVEALLEAGVLRKGKGGPQFIFHRYPLLFPILEKGRPVYLQGRHLSGSGPKYLNLARVSVPTLFNVDALSGLAPSSPVFLCEGAPDTMMLQQEGFAAAGVVGSGGFKQRWVEQLAPFKIHLALDNDQAGRKGAERIRELLHQEDLPVRILELPEGFKDVNDFFLKHSKADFEELVAKARLRVPNLYPVVKQLVLRIGDRNDPYSVDDLALRIHRWFERNGGVFLYDDEDRCFLRFENRVYRIGQNLHFNSLMFRKTSLSPSQHPGRTVWEMLTSLCCLEGRQLGQLSWTHAGGDGSLYINLHNRRNQILRLAPNLTEVLPNCSNAAGVMLIDTKKMRPIRFDPSVDPREACRLLQELLIDYLACPLESRWFIVAWLLCAFFLEYSEEKALLKMSGETESGKTTATRLLAALLYGIRYTQGGSVASYYSAASQDPYLICDNLETEYLTKWFRQFLLHAASGVERAKRKQGTDSENVHEYSRALVAITAIEPLNRFELINRTYDVEFKEIYKQPRFRVDHQLKRLIGSRDRILSGLLVLFSREVMPGFDDHCNQMLARLQALYPGHPKKRVDPFLSMMLVILRSLLKALEAPADLDQRLWELTGQWIKAQKSRADDTERGTNLALYLLEMLVQQMQLRRRKKFRLEFGLDFERRPPEGEKPASLSFVANAMELMSAFQSLSKIKGFRMPFEGAQQLGVRISCERKVLEKTGWERELEKTVRGMRYYRYTRYLK